MPLMKDRSKNLIFWSVAIVIGSILNASLFMVLPNLGRSEPPPPAPVIELEFMAWQTPVKKQPLKPKAPPKKPKPKPQPKPKPKPKPKIEKPAPKPAPKPVEKPVLTEETDPEKEQQVDMPPVVEEPEEPIVPDLPAVETAETTEETLPIPAPIFQLTGLPRFVHREAPVYPPDMLAQGKEGRVKLAVLIDTQGRIRKVDVIKSAGEAFDKAAIAAIKASTFLPGNIEGKPVTVLMKIPVKFKIQ